MRIDTEFRKANQPTPNIPWTFKFEFIWWHSFDLIYSLSIHFGGKLFKLMGTKKFRFQFFYIRHNLTPEACNYLWSPNCESILFTWLLPSWEWKRKVEMDFHCLWCFVEREGTSLLEILANQHSTWGFKVRGDVVFNGVTTSPAGLHDRVAFVQQDAHWCPDMTVRQILLFTALLQAPGHSNRNFDTKGRVRICKWVFQCFIATFHVLFF